MAVALRGGDRSMQPIYSHVCLSRLRTSRTNKKSDYFPSETLFGVVDACGASGIPQLQLLSVQSANGDQNGSREAKTLRASHFGRGRKKFRTHYFSFAYSALASFRMGMSGSASFQSVRKSM